MVGSFNSVVVNMGADRWQSNPAPALPRRFV
jgi:hypothetical protein